MSRLIVPFSWPPKMPAAQRRQIDHTVVHFGRRLYVAQLDVLRFKRGRGDVALDFGVVRRTCDGQVGCQSSLDFIAGIRTNSK